MWTGKYELVVVWESGETDVYEYDTLIEAEIGERGMEMANGNQIQWCGIRPQLH